MIIYRKRSAWVLSICLLSLLAYVFCLPTVVKSEVPGTLKWKVELAEPGNKKKALSGSHPAIDSAGNIYVSSPRGLYSIAPNGDINWKAPDYQANPPVLTTDGTLYSLKRKENHITALDSENGSVQWSHRFPPTQTPVLTDNNTMILYIKQADILVKSPRVLSFPATWNRGLTSIHRKGQMASAPSVSLDGNLYFGITGDPSEISTWDYFFGYPGHSYEYRGFSPDGTQDWTYRYQGETDVSPAIGANGTIYTTINLGSGLVLEEGYLYAFTPSGDMKWRVKTDNAIHHDNDATLRNSSFPVVGPNETVYVGSSTGELFAVDSDGNTKWTYNAGSSVVSSPAVSEDGTIYVGSNDGTLHALNPDGTVKWTFKSQDSIHSSIAIGQKGTIYFTNWAGYLYAVNGDGGGLADSPWPKYRHDRRNTGSQTGVACKLEPEFRIRPKRININGGVLTVFISGFKDADEGISSIDPGSIKLAGAEPVRWQRNPQFLQLKFRRDQLSVSLNSSRKKPKWTKTDLGLKGSLNSSGCFDVEKEVTVRP